MHDANKSKATLKFDVTNIEQTQWFLLTIWLILHCHCVTTTNKRCSLFGTPLYAAFELKKFVNEREICIFYFHLAVTTAAKVFVHELEHAAKTCPIFVWAAACYSTLLLPSAQTRCE